MLPAPQENATTELLKKMTIQTHSVRRNTRTGSKAQEPVVHISPNQLADMYIFIIIIDKIVFGVERMRRFEFIYGSCCDCFLPIYSPRRGI